MTKKNNITLLLIISVVAACTKTDIEPNIIFKNASVYTVNKKQPWASSVVVQNEKIIFVGSDDDALAFTNKNSQIIDLNKKMILLDFMTFMFTLSMEVLHFYNVTSQISGVLIIC